jgi:hypothetical protein
MAQQFVDTRWAQSSLAQTKPVLVRSRCLETGCAAYSKFMRGLRLAAQQQQQLQRPHTSFNRGALNNNASSNFMGAPVRFGFHGTSPDGVPAICCEGFDTTLRSGQIHGPGEYFASDPKLSESYARGEAQMLLCVLIDGPWLKVPPAAPTMIVVDNPQASRDVSFCLPIGVLVYGDLNTCVNFNKSCRAKPSISKVFADNLHREWQDLEVSWDMAAFSKKVSEGESALRLPHPQYTFFTSNTSTTTVPEGERISAIMSGGPAGSDQQQSFYQCPSGHIFTIGDCGSLVEDSTCPTCGVDINLLL